MSEIEHFYMYKNGFGINSLQLLMCHKIKPNQNLTNDIKEINILQDTFQKHSLLNFTHELNKNDKIFFLDVLIETNNKNDNFTSSTYKTPHK